MSERSFETKPLFAQDAKSGFECGKAALDEFLVRYAGQNQRAGVSRTWVLRRPENKPDLPPVLGFYTLTLGTVQRETLPTPSGQKNLPRYPLPVVLLGRLARDRRAGGLRVGERLLVDAHARALAISGQAGCIGVIVDAKDADAEGFYKHYGYERIQLAEDTNGWPARMFLSMETIRAVFAEEE